MNAPRDFDHSLVQFSPSEKNKRVSALGDSSRMDRSVYLRGALLLWRGKKTKKKSALTLRSPFFRFVFCKTKKREEEIVHLPFCCLQFCCWRCETEGRKDVPRMSRNNRTERERRIDSLEREERREKRLEGKEVRSVHSRLIFFVWSHGQNSAHGVFQWTATQD